MGGDTVSGLMFADDFEGTPATPEGWLKTDREGTRVGLHSRKWRVTANFEN